MKLAALIIALMLVPASNHAQGFIVPNGITYEGFVPGAGSVFHVLQNPTNSDHSGFFLNPASTTEFLFASFLNEGVRAFFVAYSDPVSLSAIQTGSYSELLYPNNYTLNEGIPFYLGLYTGYLPQNGVYQNPMFGWAQLVNNGGVIELMDGALAYGADGIYAGTQNIIQPVPEPGRISLFGLVAALVACANSRLFRRRKPGDQPSP